MPSKALLAASGRVREMQNTAHLASLGIQLGSVNFERQPIADHAKNLATTIKGNLQRSLESIGVDILKGAGKLTGEEKSFRGLGVSVPFFLSEKKEIKNSPLSPPLLRLFSFPPSPHQARTRSSTPCPDASTSAAPSPPATS